MLAVNEVSFENGNMLDFMKGTVLQKLFPETPLKPNPLSVSKFRREDSTLGGEAFNR